MELLVVLVISLLALLTLNLFQFWFWSRHTSRLVDKLMCRNYAEYKQVEQLGVPQKPRTQHAEEEPRDDEVLKDLNRMLGGA